MSEVRWMQITPDRWKAKVHIYNRGHHRNYYVGDSRLSQLIGWVRENASDVAPWFINGKIELEVYFERKVKPEWDAETILRREG